MIKLTDKYYIHAERSQYILCELSKREDPETGEIEDDRRIIGYYATIASLLKGFKSYLLRKKIAEYQITTIDELIKEVQRLNDEESKLLSSLEV